MKFNELPLKQEILKALERMGFSDLTPIQEQAIPHILSGRDLIASAETGSGKTSACGVPLVQNIDPLDRTIQALVVVPTRELALQYVDEISHIAQYVNVVPFAIYGGFDAEIQKAKIQDLVHIMIATPGRLIDLMYSGNISLSNVKTFVLDEADEMLDQGFLEDIDFLMSCLVQKHQTLLFSATMPPEMKRLAETYLKDPVTLELNIDVIAPQSLEHNFIFIPGGSRRDSLVNILKASDVDQAIIFCNSRHSSERLFTMIKNSLPAVEHIHGGLEQDKRSSIIRRFRSRQIRFMIATDLAGRGLDFHRVSHVINYDFPRDTITYTHRTGRTGRMGRVGAAYTLVTPQDLNGVRKLMLVNRITPRWIGKEPTISLTRPIGTKPGKNRPRPRSAFAKREKPGTGNRSPRTNP